MRARTTALVQTEHRIKFLTLLTDPNDTTNHNGITSDKTKGINYVN